ncbi:MAG: DUF3137 domain-containing protein [Oscillospiraceae bacterium]|nr:DUF3137 domain-containing protein [Oscillospiraceae bacterium]
MSHAAVSIEICASVGGMVLKTMNNFQDQFTTLKKSIKTLQTLTIPLAIVGILLCVGAVMLGDPEQTYKALVTLMFISGIAAIIGAVAVWAVAKNKEWKLKQLVSDNVTVGVLKDAFELHEYSPQRAVPHDLVYNSRLISGWSDYSGSDLVRGKYKGQNFMFSDIDLTETVTTTDTEGNSTTTTYECFKGQWIILEPAENKTKISGELRLRSKGKSGGGFFGSLKNTRSVKVTKLPKSTIETESIAFNKQFQIEAKDGHETFLILTPLFMEQITEAETASGGKLFVYFSGRQIHIAIYNSRNLLEHCSRNKAHREIDSLREYQANEVKYITGIMDIFLQNDKLF